MKKTIHLNVLLFILIPFINFAQSLSPEVIASGGDYFEGSTVSLSWTLGEIATETYSNGSVILTQGFQQPWSVVLHGIDVDLLVYLEGPYQSGSMGTDLKTNGVITLSQPYNTPPWNYTGTEAVGSIPPNVVDWVLVDLRDATSAASATGATSVEMQAAFLLNDGSVVGLDGSSALTFTADIVNSPYIVVWHRNHLGILSSGALSESGGAYTYDFSTSLSQAYGGGAGYKLIDTGIYGMVGGDTNGDGTIDSADKTAWATEAGSAGYLPGDHNLDTQSDNKDKNDIWVENETLSSQVPN